MLTCITISQYTTQLGMLTCIFISQYTAQWGMLTCITISEYTVRYVDVYHYITIHSEVCWLVSLTYTSQLVSLYHITLLFVSAISCAVLETSQCFTGSLWYQCTFVDDLRMLQYGTSIHLPCCCHLWRNDIITGAGDLLIWSSEMSCL